MAEAIQGKDENASPTQGKPTDPGKGRLLTAMTWMLVLSLLLFWLPVLGMLIAGLVGGRKAGGVVTAIGAVLLPMAVVAFVMFFMATALTGWPLLGALAGLGAGYLAVANAGPLLVGAVIGGILAPSPRPDK